LHKDFVRVNIASNEQLHMDIFNWVREACKIVYVQTHLG